MMCPRCSSGDLDLTFRCGFCGIQLSIREEVEIRSAMPAPRTRAIQEDRFDYAIREA